MGTYDCKRKRATRMWALSNSNKELITWPGGDGSSTIRVAPSALSELVEQVMSGFRRYPWGGVEVGGILFGNRTADGAEVHQLMLADCEHAHGPAFHLSDKDLDNFQRLLTSSRQRDGLVPVGWFHSLGKSDLHLSEAGRQLHERFFPEASSVALVVRRSRTGPVAIALFHRDRNGAL